MTVELILRVFPVQSNLKNAFLKMAKNTAKLLDVIALTVNLPEYTLWYGQVGTVVEQLADGAAFEVELSDRKGRTVEFIRLRPEHAIALHFEPVSPDLKPEIVTA